MSKNVYCYLPYRDFLTAKDAVRHLHCVRFLTVGYELSCNVLSYCMSEISKISRVPSLSRVSVGRVGGQVTISTFS